MASPPAKRRVYRFGRFEVDCYAGAVRGSGIRIRVQDQPLKLPVALLESPGESIAREELHQRLWPGETFVDFEHGPNAAITEGSVAFDFVDADCAGQLWADVEVYSVSALYHLR